MKTRNQSNTEGQAPEAVPKWISGLGGRPYSSRPGHRIRKPAVCAFSFSCGWKRHSCRLEAGSNCQQRTHFLPSPWTAAVLRRSPGWGQPGWRPCPGADSERVRPAEEFPGECSLGGHWAPATEWRSDQRGRQHWVWHSERSRLLHQRHFPRQRRNSRLACR